jgi:hypothetical protein
LNEEGPSLYKYPVTKQNHYFYFPASFFFSMLSGISKHPFGAYPALLLLVILARHQSCSAIKNCAPSSCGNIHNISYPFRLSTDPNNSCGNKKYELTCENNRPALYLNNGVKYYVQAIHYSNLTIRLVDADVQKDDCFSIPRHSLIIDYSFSGQKGYYLPYNRDRGNIFQENPWHIQRFLLIASIS